PREVLDPHQAILIGADAADEVARREAEPSGDGGPQLPEISRAHAHARLSWRLETVVPPTPGGRARRRPGLRRDLPTSTDCASRHPPTPPASIAHTGRRVLLAEGRRLAFPHPIVGSGACALHSPPEGVTVRPLDATLPVAGGVRIRTIRPEDRPA